MTTALIIIAWYLSGVVSSYAIFKHFSYGAIDDQGASIIVAWGLFGPIITFVAIIFGVLASMAKLIKLADRWISK